MRTVISSDADAPVHRLKAACGFRISNRIANFNWKAFDLKLIETQDSDIVPRTNASCHNSLAFILSDIHRQDLNDLIFPIRIHGVALTGGPRDVQLVRRSRLGLRHSELSV